MVKVAMARVAKTCQSCQSIGANFSQPVLICLQSRRKNCPTMSTAHISYIIALWATSTVNSNPSNMFLALVLSIVLVFEIAAPVHAAPVHAAPVLEAPKLEAPVLVAPVLVAPVLVALVLTAPVLEAPVLHNFKGIYAVLSRIWKSRKSRFFGANFLCKKFSWCYNFRFLQLWRWPYICVCNT